MIKERVGSRNWSKYLFAANIQSLNLVKGQLWGAWMFVIAKGQPADFHQERWCWCLSCVFLKS